MRAAAAESKPTDLLGRLRAFFLDAAPSGDVFPFAKAAGVALLVLFLTILRKPVPVIIPQFWADDGPAFFQQALESGARTFLIAHGGYYHTSIRLIALVGSLMPVALVPHLYLLAAITVLVFVAGYVFSPRISLKYPTLLALCLGLVPHGGEVYFTLANVNFYFGLVLALLLVSDPPVTRRQQIGDLVLIALVAVSGPFSLILAPLFVIRALRERTPALILRAALIGIGAAIQLTQVIANRIEGKDFRLRSVDVLTILGRRLLAPLLWGPFGAPEKSAVWLGPLLGVGALALVALLAWGFGRRREDKPLYLLGAILLVVGAALSVARGAPETLFSVWSQDRFFFVPLVLLLWCLVQTLNQKSRMRLLPAAGLLAFTALHTMGQPCLGIFEMKDMHWAEQSRCIGGPSPCVIAINPPGWFVRYAGTAPAGQNP